MSFQCSECGAEYDSEVDSCSARFDRLLALDHSRHEPWGSRHGQAFAAFALQHAARFSASLDAAWSTLYRIYCRREVPATVFASMRQAVHGSQRLPSVPQRPAAPSEPPRLTIDDLGDFPATRYPEQLDAWCRAALQAWDSSLDVRPVEDG